MKMFWIQTFDADGEGDFYADDEGVVDVDDKDGVHADDSNVFEIQTFDADDEGVVESHRESILLLSAAISRQNPAGKSPVAEFTTHLQKFHKLTFPHITSWTIWALSTAEQNKTRMSNDVGSA